MPLLGKEQARGEDVMTILETPLFDEEQKKYVPILEGMVDITDALEFLKKKYSLLGFEVKKSVLHLRNAKGELPGTVKIGDQLFFDPEELDQIHFRVQNIKWPSPLPRVVSARELDRLQHKYGPLVDIDGFIEEIYKYTLKHYGAGKRYTRGAIKAKRSLRTVLVVAWSGSEKRKMYWYPLNQIPLLNWNVDMHKRERGVLLKEAI